MKTTIRDAGNALRKAAEERIDCSQPVRVPQMLPGTMWAQGDIGILRIAELPKGAAKIEMLPGGQIAPGTTRGSRHCLDERTQRAAQLYRFPGDQMSDLCLRVADEWTLEHPEHVHCTFDAGLYQFVHEQNERRQRVTD